jgi:hypothetical protein
MSRKALTTPTHEHLDDELLSNVHGGTGTRPPGGTGGGHGNGTGGGDGLGWLRHLLRELLR